MPRGAGAHQEEVHVSIFPLNSRFLSFKVSLFLEHLMIVIFQDHSKQVYDQLYESKSGFCGFEQIPKDLMYKGEILQMQY